MFCSIRSGTRVMAEETPPADGVTPTPDDNSVSESFVSTADESPGGTFEAPRIGSTEMPPWNTGELIDAPKFTRRNWFALLGPG